MSKVFTSTVILQIYEESVKEKKAKEGGGVGGQNNPEYKRSLSAAWRKNMKSNHNLDLSGVQQGGVNEHKGGLTNEMLRNVQNPAILHNQLMNNILNASKIGFDGDQGLINAKDLQIQCLFEYEKLKSKNSRKRR